MAEASQVGVPTNDTRPEGAASTDPRLASHSPSQGDIRQNIDPNNAAYLALRNHPETTIRPINSGQEGMRTEGPDNDQSPRSLEENLFKQVGSFTLVATRSVVVPM